MTEPVVVTLPYPPSANRLWRFVKGCATPLKSREYRDWLARAEAAIPLTARNLIRGPHRIDIAVDRPDRRARDLDNLTKPTLDALKDTKLLKGVIRDDSDALSISIRWKGPEPVAEPQVTVCVFPEPA